MTGYAFYTLVYLTEDAFRDSSAFEIPKLDLHFLSYVLTTVKSRGESRIKRVIGNSLIEYTLSDAHITCIVIHLFGHR
jgi:hypothetical protein